MKTLEEVKLEEKIAQYRNKWLEAKKKNDIAMCKVYERCVRALKIGAGILV